MRNRIERQSAAFRRILEACRANGLTKDHVRAKTEWVNGIKQITGYYILRNVKDDPGSKIWEERL